MRGAEVGADLGARPEWQWDVALSFAGAQRNYVEQVAEALTAQGCAAFTTPTSRSNCGAST